MRALCGAIIVAGAVIGMGLTAQGFGSRYHTGLENTDKDGQPILLHLSQMDRPLASGNAGDRVFGEGKLGRVNIS